MVRMRSGLLPLNLLVIVLVAIILFFPYDALRIIIGIPFLLFFPGYTLVAALFPKKGMGGVERIALSLGLSIAVVPLIGLILNYTPWGIKLEPILYSTASFIFITSIIAWFRQKRLAEAEHFGIEFQLGMPGWGGATSNRVLSIILVFAILGALGMVGYVIVKPKVGQRFTEFYILGIEGNAADYPRELVVGQEGKVVLGIVNNEYETVTYQVEVRIEGIKNKEVEGITLGHEEKWENELSFMPEMAGENQKVEFLLYKDGKTEPYLEPLRLWLDVIE